MKIRFLCPAWGNELPFPAFVERARTAGYDGVELSLPNDDPHSKQEIIDTVQATGSVFVGQHWETSSGDFTQHKAEYIGRLYNVADGQPLLINSQTGKDHFSFEQNLALIDAASDFSNDTGIKVVHETHRGKFSFALHITRDFLAARPDLRLCADFSHWCNVAESMLDDQAAALELAISRADHIHARVGHIEGPQVPDPRAPEWAEALEKHLGWWMRIVDHARSEGQSCLCITPEFGPYPYMTPLPGSRQPIADQWEINLFMMELVKARLKEEPQGAAALQ